MSAVNRNLIMHTLILRSKRRDYAQPRTMRRCERMQHAALQCEHVQPVICRQIRRLFLP